MTSTGAPLRIAVLIKQIPVIDEMKLGPDGRLVRDGMDLEMSAYCRRAVSKAVDLVTSAEGGSVRVLTLGPPAAEDVLREAIAWGRGRGADIRGILVTDPAFVGSDTIATARALSAAVLREGPFDLILAGKNSLDADTGQVPPQLAELLDLPFAAGVKHVDLRAGTLRLGCEHDDTWVDLEMRLPALLTCAERLCDPTKVAPAQRAEVPKECITTLSAADIGPGAWGAGGSLTQVGDCRAVVVDRSRILSPDAPLDTQVRDVVRELIDRGALDRNARTAPPLPATAGPGRVIAVLADSAHDTITSELCGLAARLAAEVNGSTVLLAAHHVTADDAGSWGTDHLVRFTGVDVEEDIAAGVASWVSKSSKPPWAILAGSTTYGREVASRVAAAIGAGLTGDASDVEILDGRLIAWKPAFGGQLVAAVTATSPVQMVTIRSGIVMPSGRRCHIAEESRVALQPRGRVVVHARSRQDTLESLGDADVVIGVGQGVPIDELHQLDELRDLLGAQIGCTRKLTDVGAMPHARQIGVTGRAISPALYVAIGASGKFNHMVGVRSAGMVLAINPDPDAPVFQHADVGIVAKFQDSVPLLIEALRKRLP